jgi:hypothetical protein
VLFLSLKTEDEGINSIAEIPLLGELFLFVFIFIPPVGGSLLTQLVITKLNNDNGFTIAMFVLLPLWNLFLWIKKVRLFVLFIPAWLLFGVIAIIKAITHDY